MVEEKACNEHCPSCQRQKVRLPTNQLLLNFIQDEIKILIGSPMVLNGKSNILHQAVRRLKPKGGAQRFLTILINIRGEEDS